MGEIANETGNHAQNKDEKQKAKDTSISLVQFIQIIVSCVGLIAAFLYFLGRLHIEAYYSGLGMSPSVMKFDTNDYMFSSFNIIMMIFIIGLILYAGRERIRGTSTHRFLWFQVTGKKDWVKISGLFLIPFIFYIIIRLAFYNLDIPYLSMAGLLGLFLGLPFGIILLVCMEFIQWNIRSKSSKIHYLAIATAGFLLLLFTPLITSDIANIEAKSDRLTFPEVKLVSENPLPSPLQSSAETSNQSIKVKMITTNNGMIYVLQQENESDDNWQVYAIPQEDSNQIIYFYEKK